MPHKLRARVFLDEVAGMIKLHDLFLSSSCHPLMPSSGGRQVHRRIVATGASRRWRVVVMQAKVTAKDKENSDRNHGESIRGNREQRQ